MLHVEEPYNFKALMGKDFYSINIWIEEFSSISCICRLSSENISSPYDDRLDRQER